tara:strand:+ start:368 stop:592 length:225 start_codon:yes stop_codon:yes gene_type:complete
MRLKQKNIASLFGFVTEQQLSGCKVTIKRVMRQCVKTLNRVISTNLSIIRLDALGKFTGNPINPVKQTLFNYVI